MPVKSRHGYSDVSKPPHISVVMSVYKNADHVHKTISSVLTQTGVDFDFIIISDGADDDVIDVINQFSDPRITLLEQPNQGLTKALIYACEYVKSDFIARIDAGDIMVQSRLLVQSTLLSDQPNIGIVTSWVRVTTEEGYFLYDVKQTSQSLEQSLRGTSVGELRSMFHASVMFRRSVYRHVGGYRKQFYFSQDCDLWTRMIENCNVAVIPESLTVGLFSANGLSGNHASKQQVLSQLIARANRLRQQGDSDSSILSEAQSIKPGSSAGKSSKNNFRGYYFIAKILYDNRSKFAKRYWYTAFKAQPLNYKVWVFGFLSLFFFT